MKQVNALEIILDKSMSPLKVLSESFCVFLFWLNRDVCFYSIIINKYI